MKAHINIPIFIPHLGCPNLCVFCNQRYISGHGDFDISSVRREIDAAISTKRKEQTAQIAFFGGSFTGIGDELMISLLDIAEEYVSSGEVESIRLSTRPDYIDRHILDILSRYHVKSIELGIQSMDPYVLSLCKRGHTPEDSRRAASLIHEYGFEFVSQMMIGLPGATPESEIMTACECCDMGANAARIYPTVVFRGSELCDMTASGSYTPLAVEEAVTRTKDALLAFYRRGVPCIRIGLCSAENLSSEETYFAGPNHPAIGELAESALYLDEIKEAVAEASAGGGQARELTVEVAFGAVSKAVGHRGCNREIIRNGYGFKRIRFVEKEDLSGYGIRIAVV